MEQQNWWDAFKKTGRVEDYLRYRGIDIYEQGMARKGRRHAPDDRRTDYPGK